MWEVLGFFALGLLLVTLGADSLVKGASGLAQRLGAGAASAGLALVAVGSSVPELAISFAAIVQGHYALALGNVIGSCIANLGLIVGVAALVKPLSVGFRLVSFGLPLLLLSAVGLLAMSHNGTLGYYDGAVLLFGVIVFGWTVRRAAANESDAVRKELAYAGNTQAETVRNVARLLIGLGVVGYGAWLASDRAYQLAGLWQMSELWAGLTILAVGSAIPELAVAVVAAKRGHGNIVVGSAVSSSVVNLLLILGLMALWHPLPLASSLVWVEIPALIAFALAFFPMIQGDAQVSRREGLVLVIAFAGWMAFQFLAGRA